jgi:hypothetical protein
VSVNGVAVPSTGTITVNPGDQLSITVADKNAKVALTLFTPTVYSSGAYAKLPLGPTLEPFVLNADANGILSGTTTITPALCAALNPGAALTPVPTVVQLLAYNKMFGVLPTPGYGGALNIVCNQTGTTTTGAAGATGTTGATTSLPGTTTSSTTTSSSPTSGGPTTSAPTTGVPESPNAALLPVVAFLVLLLGSGALVLARRRKGAGGA